MTVCPTCGTELKEKKRCSLIRKITNPPIIFCVFQYWTKEAEVGEEWHPKKHLVPFCVDVQGKKINVEIARVSRCKTVGCIHYDQSK